MGTISVRGTRNLIKNLLNGRWCKTDLFRRANPVKIVRKTALKIGLKFLPSYEKELRFSYTFLTRFKNN